MVTICFSIKFDLLSFLRNNTTLVRLIIDSPIQLHPEAHFSCWFSLNGIASYQDKQQPKVNLLQMYTQADAIGFTGNGDWEVG